MFRAFMSAALLGAVALAPMPGSAANDDRVRPGLAFRTEGGGQCSFGFLLSGSDRQMYAATAGHCGNAEDTERLWPRGDGPEVSNDKDRPIGRFVYAVEDTPNNVDFGLIRLYKGVKGNPQMCGWGGPTRLLSEPRAELTELHQHGRGLVVGDVVPNRTGFAPSLPREPYTVVQGPFVPGDSGSAVTTADGAAVGMVAELVVNGAKPTAGVGVVRLEHAVAAASRRLGIRFALRTAPLLPTPAATAAC